MAKNLEVFQELELVGDQELVRRALLEAAGSHWTHAPTREKAIKDAGSGDLDVLVFDSNQRSRLPKCAVFLFYNGAAYRVTNIVPYEVSELSMSVYNRILRDFKKDVGDKASSSGVELRFTDPDRPITDWLEKEAADRLRRFSALANKSTGATHPLDRERWFDLVIAAHTSEGELSPDLLQRWLVDVDGWSEDAASDLATEYERLLSFLVQYDRRKQQ